MDNEIDPNKAILGKWELVLLTRHGGEDDIQYKPTGYVEYLPGGRMGWYDYTTEKYTLFEGKYWFKSFKGIEDTPQKKVFVYWELLIAMMK